MPMDHAFFAGMWPVLCNNIAAGAPKTFEEGGILKSDDPFCAFAPPHPSSVRLRL